MSEAVALIADDDEYFRMAISAILKGPLGFSEVIETGSFDEAVERLASAGPVSLAVFDLSMPGIESAAELRSVRDHFDVDKLAVVSASRDRADILQSLEAGAHGFVSKGQGVRDLTDALQQILHGDVYVPRAVTALPPESRKEPASVSSAPMDARLPQMTPRQLAVLEMLVEGKSNKEIARALDLGQSTVKVHLAALFRKLGVTNRASAAVAGARVLPHSSAPRERRKEGKSDDRSS